MSLHSALTSPNTDQLAALSSGCRTLLGESPAVLEVVVPVIENGYLTQCSLIDWYLQNNNMCVLSYKLFPTSVLTSSYLFIQRHAFEMSMVKDYAQPLQS